MPQQSRQPSAILGIGFLASQHLDVHRIRQDDLHSSFQNVVYRFPVGTGALHHRLRASHLFEPYPESFQLHHVRAESPNLHGWLLMSQPNHDANRQNLLADIDSRTSFYLNYAHESFYGGVATG